MNQLKQEAILSANAARNASAEYVAHRDICPQCAEHLGCDIAADLQARAYNASKTAQVALQAYLPLGSLVVYSGPATRAHGEWWVAGTDRDTQHGTYTLIRPKAAMLTHVEVADVSSVEQHQPGSMLESVRTALREITAVLAQCDVSFPVTADVDGYGRVSVFYSEHAWNQAWQTAHTNRDQARSSYVIAALKSLNDMRMLARAGALKAVTKRGEVARKTREVIESETTRRPRT
ncbi:hypothetical protein [Nonomuraea sp. NPDC050786]|uniref:hypothetical protein n=1 Tax=Nonomuraea sp. NPDC050786 TaxID=3154840 RepID=UPI0033CBB478